MWGRSSDFQHKPPELHLLPVCRTPVALLKCKPISYSQTGVDPHWLSFQKVRGPWVISATYVGTIINSLTFGQLVDKWGRKPIFHITNFTFLLCRLVTFSLFWSSSTLSGWSPSMLPTITGRFLSSQLSAQVSSPSV